MKNTLIVFIAFIILDFIKCSWQPEELIEVPQGEPTLAVYADLSNENGFSAYVVKRRYIGEIIEWAFNFNDSIVDLNTGKTVFKKKRDTYWVGNDTLFDYLVGVKVKVFEEGKLLTELKQEYARLPLYTDFDKKITPGKKYQIEVTAPGFPTVTGEQTAISDMNAERITFSKNSFQSINNGLLSEIVVKFNDPEDESNSYFMIAELRLTGKKTNDVKSYIVPLYKTDPTSTTNNIISDKGFNGKTYSWRVGADVQRFLTDTVGRNAVLTVLAFPINSDLEKFYRTLEAREANYENPFTEPVTPFFNVKGGLGIFSVSGGSSLQSFRID